jgi:outer membrane autotransporter protein
VNVLAPPTGQPQPSASGVLFGIPNTSLAEPLVARIVDPATGKPVAGAAVSWAVVSGGGALSGATNVSDAQGLVQAKFTLGPGSGDNTVRVTATQSGLFFDFVIRNQQTAVVEPGKQVLAPQAQVAVNTPIVQLNNIRQHLDNLRLLRNPTVTQGVNVTYNGQALPSLGALSGLLTDKKSMFPEQSGGGASADRDVERFGLFIQGEIDIGKQDAPGTQQGFDLRTNGLTIGADYRLVGDHVVGAAIGFVRASADLTENAGNQTAKGYNLSLFGEYVPVADGYIDVVLNYGRNRYDATRRAIDAAGSSVEHTGKPSGNQFGLSVSAGYQYYVQSLTLTPYARVEYIDASIDAFEESGGPDALQFGSQRYKSTVLSLGGQAQYSISTSWGVLVPFARVEYQYAASNSGEQVNVQIAGVPTSTTLLPALGNDRSYGNLALGASLVMPRGISGFFNYQRLFGKQSYSDDRYTLGFRFGF